MFHLGWFAGGGYGVDSWRDTWSGAGAQEWTKPQLYVDAARSLERASFDYLILEDGLMFPDSYQGSKDASRPAATGRHRISDTTSTSTTTCATRWPANGSRW
jgi:hypothetical protein